MKTHRFNLFACGLLLVTASLAPITSAATYTYSNTAATTTQWSAGTNWSATPVSATTTTLSFSATQAAGVNTIANNDIGGNFLLNSLSFTNVGPVSGTAPTLTIQGGTLEFVSNGGTTPTLVLGGTGTVLSKPTISNNIVLTNNLAVSLATNQVGTLSGVISGTGTLAKNTGTSTLVLSNTANSFSGAVTISNGTISAANIGNTGSNSALGTNGSITIGGGSNSGQLTWTGNSETTDKAFAMGGSTGGTTISASTAGQTLTISSALVSGTSTGATRGLTLTGSGNITFNGAIGNGTGASGGVVTLTKTGTGVATLGGANSYSGQTTVSAGTLALSGGSAISDTGTISLGNISGAVLSVLASETIGSLQGGGTTGGNVSLAASQTLTVAETGAQIYAGVISGATGALTKSGVGSLTLSGANTYAGTTTISAGTLAVSGGSAISNSGTVSLANTAGAVFSVVGSETIASLQGGGSTGGNVSLASSQTLTVAETGTQTFAGQITGPGAFTKSGAGSLTLSNSANDFGGAVTVSAGTVYVSSVGNASASSYLGTNGTLNLGSSATSGTLRLLGSANETTDKVVNLSGTTGGGTLTVQGGAVTTFSSALGVSGSGAKTFNLATSGGNAGMGINFNGLIADGAVSSAISVRVNGSGSGSFSLGNTANSFTGSVTIDGNIANKTTILSAALIGTSGSNSSLGQSGTINIGSSVAGSNNLLAYTGSGETTAKVINLVGTVGNGGVSQSGTGLIKYTSPMTATGAGAKSFLLSGSTAGTGEFAGAIVNGSGTTSLFKDGTGTWTLSGINSYTGGSVITQGTVNFANANALGSSGTVRVSGGTLQWGSGVTTDLSSRLTLTAGSVATFDTNGNDVSFGSAVVSTLSADTIPVQSGGLIKAGVGKLTLSADATYTGATAINVGTLQIGAGGTTGSISTTSGITNNSILSINRSNALTLGVAIDGSGAVNQIGAGTTTLTAANSYSGLTTISAGTLALGAAGTIDSSSGVYLDHGGTFDVSAKTGSYSVTNLTGSGNVTGKLTVSTQLAIGNSPGTVDFSSDLTLGVGSTYLFELIGGTTGAGSADLGNVAGNLSLGSATLDLAQYGAGTYTANDRFTLFSYTGSLSGTFSGLADNSTFTDAGGEWLIHYNDLTGAGTNGGTQSKFVTITAVPEPDAATLVGGLGVLALLRRRRANA